MSGCPSENCHNRGLTWAPTVTSPTTNVSQNIEEDQEAALTLCQATPSVVFHPDARTFSPIFLKRGSEWPALPARTDTSLAPPALTGTAAPDTATPAVVGSGKINSNHAQPMDVKIGTPSPPANPDIDVTLAASF